MFAYLIMLERPRRETKQGLVSEQQVVNIHLFGSYILYRRFTTYHRGTYLTVAYVLTT